MRTAVRRLAIALVGSATLGYLAYGLWQAQRTGEQRASQRQWFVAVASESARVGAIIQSIREESQQAERNAADEGDWTGVYQSGGRDRDLIALSESGQAAMDVFFSCIPPTRRASEGRIVDRDGQRIRIEWNADQIFGAPPRGYSEWYLITWGERRLLVPRERLASLKSQARAFDPELGTERLLFGFVREGDEDKPVFGEPDWPPEIDGGGE